MPVLTKGNKHYLFIHVPKTGGTSIEKCFIDSGFRINYRDVGGKQSLNSIRKCSPQHMDRDLINATFDLSKFSGIFMLVRDPIARIKSEFGMRNHNTYEGDPKHFSTWFNDTLSKYANNPNIYDNHFRPQKDFFIEQANVYRLEDGMSNILSKIEQDLDVKLNKDIIPHTLNRKKQSGFSTSDIVIEEHILKKIENLYISDFSLFNYK